jgi:dihydrofolate synthase/folylpolyglutamate synthase
MRINGEDIPDTTLARITERVKPIADKMTDKPTEFELITAIAFEYFYEEGCDVVVLECGMGGRLDSTNVIRDPLLSVITGIALDHTAFLGDTVEKIAAEKAGIIKDGSPLLFGGEDASSEAVIKEKCKELGSSFYKTDYSALSVKEASLSGCTLDFEEFRDIKIKLLGLYQPRNTASVLSAVKILRNRGLGISDKAVYSGLLRSKWRARFEIIKEDPTVIFDGAHNPEGISAAVESIKHYFGDKKVVVFTGVLRDKDYDYIAGRLSEIADAAFTITPDNKRALSAEEYAENLKAYGVKATACDSVGEALREGERCAKERDTALCCLGSLYTYVEVISALDN